MRVVQLGFPIGPPLCVSIGHGLWEVRSTNSGPRELRLLFFHHSERAALVVVPSFVKKTRKTPQREIEIALKRRQEFVA